MIRKKRDSHIFLREAADHYVEPHWTSERLFQVEDFGPEGSTILDPCAGWCRIPDAAAKAGYKAIASDIINRAPKETTGLFRKLDILAIHHEEVYDWWRQAKSIVTNPPFDQIEEVTRRCVALAEYKVAVICPLRRLPAAHWLRDLPLKTIWLLNPRPSMPSGSHIASGGKVGGGKEDFVWLVIQKGYRGRAGIGWLLRDRDNARDSTTPAHDAG